MKTGGVGRVTSEEAVGGTGDTQNRVKVWVVDGSEGDGDDVDQRVK